MKTVRLNKLIREDMVNSMGDQYEVTNPPPYTLLELKQIENEIATELWERFLGKYKKGIEALPEKFFNMSSVVAVSGVLSGMSTFRLYTPSGEARSLPVLYKAFGVAPIGVLEDIELAKYKQRLEAPNEKKHKWETKKKDFLDEARTLLDSVSTTKQLEEIWPEACDYLPPFAADPSKGTKLPALRVSRLNSFLEKG